MPFLHRMRAATTKTPEPREIAVADREYLSLAELSASDFEVGANLGAMTTIVADGRHWASLTGLYPNTAFHAKDRDPVSYALECLAMSIDCSRFYADDKERLPLTSILQKSPAPELIHNSQRELNVAKLSDWIADNMVSVDGQPFVRVREPTVYFDIVGPFDADRCYMTLKLGKLVPEPDDKYEHGVMATVSARHELKDLANDLITQDNRMMRLDNDIPSGLFETISSPSEDAADVARRSLVNMAKQMTWSRNRSAVPERMVKPLKVIFRDPRPEFDADALDHLAELIGRDVENMEFPRNVMAGIILDRWHQRPIELGLGRRTGIDAPKSGRPAL